MNHGYFDNQPAKKLRQHILTRRQARHPESITEEHIEPHELPMSAYQNPPYVSPSFLIPRNYPENIYYTRRLSREHCYWILLTKEHAQHLMDNLITGGDGFRLKDERNHINDYLESFDEEEIEQMLEGIL